MADANNSEQQAQIVNEALQAARVSLLECEALFESICIAQTGTGVRIDTMALAVLGAKVAGAAHLAVAEAEDSILPGERPVGPFTPKVVSAPESPHG